MAGVLCALKLRSEGSRYILAEGGSVGGGITKGTTAVISAQHDTLYSDLIKTFGAAKAKLYLEANLHAAEEYKSLAQTIPCDYEERPSVMFSISNRLQMQRETAAVKSLGFGAEFTDKTVLPYPIAGAVVFPGMAQFQPLSFLYGAAAGLNIVENTFIRRLDGTTAYTNTGKKIKAQKVIVATHFPFVNKHGLYFMKLYQKRSYVIALEGAPQLGCTIMDSAENGIYLRNYRDLLIIGGGDRRTGKGDGFGIVREYAQRYFPGLKERFAWANQDCISLDGAPYIGRYSASMPDVYVSTGFGEWGMTTSMAAAEILTDMVAGRKNRFASAFSPDRNMITGQLFANLGETLVNFITPTRRRCPHLGCALKWNAAEHTWDCPCHGSRFDSGGAVIDNPAMRDADV
jgi:FAD dependent oxidoreductase./Rieske [2Fe-2S] domain.